MSIDLSFSTLLCSCGISTWRANIMPWIYLGANERKECVLNGHMHWWWSDDQHHATESTISSQSCTFFSSMSQRIFEIHALYTFQAGNINSDPHTVHWIIHIYSTCSCHLWTACYWFLALRTSSNFSLFSDSNYFFDICPLTLFAPIYIYL